MIDFYTKEDYNIVSYWYILWKYPLNTKVFYLKTRER